MMCHYINSQAALESDARHRVLPIVSEREVKAVYIYIYI
jgi:hypothetical protein